jgi:hypothetical protein
MRYGRRHGIAYNTVFVASLGFAQTLRASQTAETLPARLKNYSTVENMKENS